MSVPTLQVVDPSAVMEGMIGRETFDVMIVDFEDTIVVWTRSVTSTLAGVWALAVVATAVVTGAAAVGVFWTTTAVVCCWGVGVVVAAGTRIVSRRLPTPPSVSPRI